MFVLEEISNFRMKIKILLVDDHISVRRGLRKILTKSPRMEVVGEARDGKEALALNDRLNPDIIVLDVEMPGMKGYEVARHLMEEGSSTPVLALSGYNEKHYILGMFASGAVGYLTKDEAPEQLLTAVSEVAAGRKGWLSPSAAQMLGVPAVPLGQNTIPALTSLENKILLCIKEGKTDHAIVTELQIEVPILLENIQSIMRKLGVKSRIEAVLRGLQEGLV